MIFNFLEVAAYGAALPRRPGHEMPAPIDPKSANKQNKTQLRTSGS